MDLCYICRRLSADKYTWCLGCIIRAAKGAARYFASDKIYTLGEERANVEYKRLFNHYERKFKKRLRRKV